MPEFSQVIRPEQLPAYEAAVAEIAAVVPHRPDSISFAVEPASYAGFLRVRFTYGASVDVFLLGYKVGQQLSKGGQGNG